MMIHNNIDAITQGDLERLVADKVLESKTIEYKEALPEHSEKGKNEFRADVTSFANAVGGDLIFGIAEKDGEPQAVCGIADKIDEAKQRLEQLLVNLVEPRIHGIQMRGITLNGKSALVLRIPRSWNAPHGVKVNEHYKFYTRTNSGKAALDIPSLKSAFLMSETISDKVRRFRDERIGRIIAGDTPAPLPDTPKVVLHMVPLSAFGTGEMIDVKRMLTLGTPAPIALAHSPSINHKINFDGLLTSDYSNRCYFQLFRTACIETTDAKIFEAVDGKNIILNFENQTITAVQSYKEIYDKLNIPPPIVIMISLHAVKGFVWYVTNIQFNNPKPIDRDTLILPDIFIEDFAQLADKNSIARALRPAFDAAWNAAGDEQCPYYDESGNRKPR